MSLQKPPDRYISLAHKVFDVESQAILGLKNKISDNFLAAAELIAKCKGKVVVTGIGKSGHIGRKIAATLTSTGTPAIFLHPAEASHGDIGIIAKEDVVIGISYGGNTTELTPILNFVSRKGVPLVAITGKDSSSLAQAAKLILDVQVDREACPLGLAPTASSTATLAMGDALAMVVLEMKGFKAENFAEIHPGGSLGFKLSRVREIMHKGDQLPVVSQKTPLREVYSVMTHRDVRGAAAVVDPSGDLLGIITDGVIRKNLQNLEDPMQGFAEDLMTKNPRTVDANELAEKALLIMEEFEINVLFVLDSESKTPKKPVGIVHIQDLLKGKIR